MESAWISLTGTIAVFIVTHIILTVWWASKTNTLLDILQKELKDLIIELKSIKEVYVKRDDVSRELGVMQKAIDTMWTKIDKLQERS